MSTQQQQEVTASNRRAQPAMSREQHKEKNPGRATCDQRTAYITRCRIYSQPEALDEWVSVLRTGLDIAMEARFKHCYDASEELTGMWTIANSIQTSTADS